MLRFEIPFHPHSSRVSRLGLSDPFSVFPKVYEKTSIVTKVVLSTPILMMREITVIDKMPVIWTGCAFFSLI